MTNHPVESWERNARLSEQLSVHRARRREQRQDAREELAGLALALFGALAILGLLAYISF